MNTNKGSIVKQSGNDVEGCRSEKVLIHPNMHIFLQYSVKFEKHFDNLKFSWLMPGKNFEI